jgi:hypothetical protein
MRALTKRLLEGELTPEKRRELTEADDGLNQIENELWRWSSSSPNLATTKAMLERVRSTLDKYQAPGMPRPMTAGDAGLAERAEARRKSPIAPGSVWKAIADRLRSRRFRLDLAIAMAALIAALVAGLNALYVGKEFGGWLDYLAALLWGITTEATLAALFAAIGRLGAPIPGSLATVPQLSTTTGHTTGSGIGTF